ncbi:MAG: Na+/H+ antiporter, NhaA family protein nonfunctional [Candidatus Saccharibacteria bacterium]|nr:Na+/H+ antiporter, NhaA family protein nonfunctional [Candidatus Saccharibacteria bacterium]
MNKIGWIIFSAVVVLLLGGLIVWTRVNNPSVDVSKIDSNVVLKASAESGNIADHVEGKADSKVILVEYGDFQCPSCGNAHPNVKALMEEYGDRIGLIFRNFPLTSIHPNARAGAAAAEAAGLQDRFWDMHDLLYANRDSWINLDAAQRTDMFASFANQLGLDAAKFKTDYASADVNKKISFDIAVGKAKKVDATPTFFLNGEKLDEKTAGGIVQGDLTAVKAKLDKLLAE